MSRIGNELIKQFLSGGMQAGISGAKSAADMQQMERGKGLDLENQTALKKQAHTLSEEAAAKRIQDAEMLSRKHPGMGVTAGENSVSLSPREPSKGALSQRRLEAQALNRVYTDQTRQAKERQQSLQDVEPLLKDPTNIDDQQLRRTLAMAVNKGALSDTDVEDALPGDVEQTLKKAYNWVQPALAPLGAKKMPIYSEGTVAGIKKLLQGKVDPLTRQIEDAGQQVRDLAPSIAPTLAADDPQTLEQLLTGITRPRMEQQKRISDGIQSGGKLSAQEQAELEALKKELGQ